jgi:uncharacterized protein YecE (DUF72 family)
MQVRIGTSGYQYAFWRGVLYSERCKEADMLAEYGSKLPTVEINATFYRMPKTAVLERWAGQVPESFRFALKASRRITHMQRLKDVGDNVRYLFDTAKALGDKLGAVLFQLPPNLRKDVPRLQAFLATLPDGARAALEFRHASWFDEEVYQLLRERNVALCISDEGEGEQATPFVATADFGYVRLRREQYEDEQLAQIGRSIAGESWTDAYAYFKHEEGAPELAARFTALISDLMPGSAER